MEGTRTLASDNWSGLCPEALSWLIRANEGSVPPYGRDDWSLSVSDKIRAFFETDAEIFFASSGTAANSLVLAHLVTSYSSVLCHEASHIHLDECGAPGFFGNGSGITPISRSPDGRITQLELQRALDNPRDLRFQPPGALSLTQTSECGTLYQADTIHSLNRCAKQHGLHTHMDGARLLMATEALQIHPSEITWKAGVDVLVLGASKLGGGVGDAIIFFNRDLARGFEYRLKQAGQVTSKMRLMTAPWLGLLEGNHYQRYARHALELAEQLELALAEQGFMPWVERQANAVFVDFPEDLAQWLRSKGWVFHNISYDADNQVVRLMTGWDTTRDTIEAFSDDLHQGLALYPR